MYEHHGDDWEQRLIPEGRYYLTRNGSTLVAFVIGKDWRPGDGLAMVGTHTDSPCLRIKPVSQRTADGFLQVGVEPYGGGMWHTWFDRDLSVAGRIMVGNKPFDVKGMKSHLVQLRKPILRIPSLAVHFGGSTPFEFNKETHLLPILGLASAELNRVSNTGHEKNEGMDVDGNGAGPKSFQPLKPIGQRHHPRLLELLASEVGCSPEDILDLELVLYDTQPACIGGLNDEFVFSARLDNLGMTYCAVEGIIQSVSHDGKPVPGENDTSRLIACFDDEEVGSTTAQGANGQLLPSVLRRLCTWDAFNRDPGDADPDASAYEQTLVQSLLVSADMAHSINPNYGARYEADHRPAMNAGTVIKVNANARYATTSPGIVLLEECARLAKRPSHEGGSDRDSGVPLQLFVMRNDHPCGSTIGPMLSAQLGVRTIDVGNAQLAMHSIRETSGCDDVGYGIDLFASFFRNYGKLDMPVVEL